MPAQPPVLVRRLPESRLKRILATMTNSGQGRPHYEISIPGSEVERTQDPDLLLERAGLTTFEASAVIHQADLRSRGTWMSSVGGRIIGPTDVGTPVDERMAGCRVRVACGRSIRRNGATTFIIQHVDSTGQVRTVRTTDPLEVLACVADLDPFRAERLCVNAVWRWDNAIFGWSSG